MAVFASSAMNANANSGDTQWRMQSFSFERRDNSIGEGYALYTDGAASNGMLFQCKDGDLRVMMSVEPVVMFDVVNDLGISHFKSASAHVGDSEELSERWFLLKRNKVVVPHKTKTTRKVFNAAANDEDIKFSIGKYKNIHVDAPPPAPDLFREFAEACELIR